MLILTRKAGQTIRIGDDVSISVVEIRGNQVRLGINAPRSVTVHREEVYDVIREQQQAAKAQPADKALLQDLWQSREQSKGKSKEQNPGGEK